MTVLASTGPSAYWYLARGTGVVSLVLLTASVVLGILGSIRFAAAPRWPRFAIDTLHRDVSLLVVVILVAHIITSVLDSFAPIKLTDGVIPFVSAYRPIWLGLGTLSFDVIVALVITSLVRRRLGYGAWRAIHWLAYVSWPIAVLHGVGTGTDVKAGWNLAVTVACLAAVLAAVVVRIARARPESEPMPAGPMLLAILTPIGLAIFTLQGPLGHGWARRAGTPASLLPKVYVTTAPVRVTTRVGSTLHAPFSARLAGTVTQTPEPGGAIVDLALRLTGGARGRLRIRLAGAPLDGGGLSMTGSQVDLVANGLASVMEGQIVSLQGQQLQARVADANGTVIDLSANLNIDNQSGTVTGTLSASPVGGG